MSLRAIHLFLGVSSNTLLKANVESVGAAECTPFYFKQSWARHNPNGLPAHQMCARGAWNNIGADTCQVCIYKDCFDNRIDNLCERAESSLDSDLQVPSSKPGVEKKNF